MELSRKDVEVLEHALYEYCQGKPRNNRKSGDSVTEPLFRELAYDLWIKVIEYGNSRSFTKTESPV